jgi:hypothetical protein
MFGCELAHKDLIRKSEITLQSCKGSRTGRGNPCLTVLLQPMAEFEKQDQLHQEQQTPKHQKLDQCS